MAKYTKTFAEYVEDGGTLPSSSFSLITDFEDLFKERYCGCEIGFETETLFAMKLDLKARLVMPVYASRISAVNSAIARLQTPSKTRSESRNYGAQHSETENEGSNTDLPIDISTATPAGTTHNEGSADISAHMDNLTMTEYVTIDENLRIFEQLSASKQGLIEKCLEEFKGLFMGIY